MKRLIVSTLLILFLCQSAWAAKYFFEKKATSGAYLWTDDDSGGGANSNWSSTASPVYTATTKPANTDTVTITSGTTCTYDEVMTGGSWANGVTLTVNGTLKACETAAAYTLKSNAADITVAATGIIQAGTSALVPYPSTCTFTIDFNSAAKSIEVASGGHLYLYCTQPTNKYIYTSAASAAWDAMDQIKVATDITADQPWTIASAQIRIVDATPLDSEIRTISSLAADEITVSAVVTNAKATGSLVALVTRNVRIINVAASDYAITYASGAGSGDYLGCEMNTVYRGISAGTGWEFAGTCEMLTTSPTFCSGSTNGATSATISGVITGPTSGTSNVMSIGLSNTYSGMFAGLSSCVSSGYGATLSGTIFGCTTGLSGETNVVVTEAATITYTGTGVTSCSGVFVYGTISNCTTGISGGTGYVLSGTMGINTSRDLLNVGSGRAYNTSFLSGTEFESYNGVRRLIGDYFESFDHDGTENTFKAWCRGGIVTSQTASPPTGYDIWYEHACEDTDPEYPCFRQYETTVQPGQTIEVEGVIRIADAEDFTDSGDIPPRLQIVDKFADPLVDDTQTALDEDIIGSYDGTDTDWQDVAVIWANQGDSPRQVIVRMLCYSDQAGATDIDEAYSVASYQDQIGTIYNTLLPVRTTVATADTALSFTLTAGEATTGAYNGMTISVTDADDGHSEQRGIKQTGGWTAGRVVTVDTAFSFTPAVGDTVALLSVSYTDLSPVTNLIGTPVALDGGSATIAGMLTKMADDNGGASFDAGTDSLEKLYGSVVVGVPTSVTAGSATVTTGTEIGGTTYAGTALDNGVYYTLAPVNPGGLDAYLVFTLTAGQKPNTVSINGYWSGNPRYCNVYAYNWVTLTWDQLSDASTRINHSTGDLNYAYTLLNEHYDPATLVTRIRFYSTSVTTTDRLYLDQVLVKVVSAGATASDIANAVYQKMAYTVYEGGVWIDTVAGTAGTDLGYHGIPTRPVSNYADALTLATALGVKRFYLKPGSSITLTTSHEKWRFIGAGSIALGGQSIADSIFEGAYEITGLSTGDDAEFIGCGIGTSTLYHAYFDNCLFKGDVTLIAANNYYAHNCADFVASGTTSFTFAATANLYLRNWRGGVEIKSLAAGSECMVDGAGRVIIDTTCSGGSLTVRGSFTITDQVVGGFLGTLTDTANTTEITDKLPTNYIMGSSVLTAKDDEIDAIVADTNELQTDWTNGGRLDLILDGIKAMTDLMAIVTTTVATVTDGNEFTITAGEDVNDAYWMNAIMVEDATDAHSEVRWIDEYVTSRSVLVDEPFSFTPAPGDKVWIMGTTYGGFLQQILSGLDASKAPIYYFKETDSGGSGGAGDTSYYQSDGTDP